MTAEQKKEIFVKYTKKFNKENKTSTHSRKKNQFFHLSYAEFFAPYPDGLGLRLKRNTKKKGTTEHLTFALTYEPGFYMKATVDSFGDIYIEHEPSKVRFAIWDDDRKAFAEGKEVTLYALIYDDNDNDENRLKNVIKQDIEYLNKKLREGPNALAIPPYYSFHEYPDSGASLLYSLFYNFNEIWYGTLKEINAVVKSLIKKEEIDENNS